MESSSYIQEYICTHKYYRHTTKNSEKRSHDFEEEWGGVYGRIWRTERGEILQLNDNIKNKILNTHVYIVYIIIKTRNLLGLTMDKALD